MRVKTRSRRRPTLKEVLSQYYLGYFLAPPSEEEPPVEQVEEVVEESQELETAQTGEAAHPQPPPQQEPSTPSSTGQQPNIKTTSTTSTSSGGIIKWVYSTGTCPYRGSSQSTSTSTTSLQDVYDRGMREWVQRMENEWRSGEIVDVYETDDGLKIVLKRSGRKLMLMVENLPPQYANCRIKYRAGNNIVTEVWPLSMFQNLAYWADDGREWKILGVVCPEE